MSEGQQFQPQEQNIATTRALEMLRLLSDCEHDQGHRHIQQTRTWCYHALGNLLRTLTQASPRNDAHYATIMSHALRFNREHFQLLQRGKTTEHAFRELKDVSALIEEGHLGDYMATLQKEQPLLAGMATSLAMLSSENDPLITRRIEGWFHTVLECAEATEASIDTVFSRFQKNVPAKASGYDETISFLENFKNDTQDIVRACIHAGCSFAVHAQQEDCAVYMTTTTSPAQTIGQGYHFRTELQDILKLPLYQKYASSVARAGVQGREVTAPTFVSVADIVNFMKFLKEYWHSFEMDLDRPTGKKHFQVNLRAGGERLSFENRRHFQDFNMRVDKEQRKHGLSLDIGGIDPTRSLAYARELGEKSQHAEIVMAYSRIVDQEGHLSRIEDPTVALPRGAAKHPYASITLSQELQEGEQYALVAAAVQEIGANAVLHHGSHFTHHIRRRINQEQYYDNFGDIARNVKNAASL